MYVSIQSFVLRRCASASSSGLPVNSGLKCDQFNCGICCIGYVGADTGSYTGCIIGACGAGACGAGDAGGAVNPVSTIVSYVLCRYNMNMCIL